MPFLMQREDWMNFKAETDCQICEKPLVKEKHFLIPYQFIMQIRVVIVGRCTKDGTKCKIHRAKKQGQTAN